MRTESSLGRGIVMIVAVGAVLGVAYNGAGLMSRPPRGIPWVAAAMDVPELESLAPADSGTVDAPATGASGLSIGAAPPAAQPPGAGQSLARPPAARQPLLRPPSARDAATLRPAPPESTSSSAAPAETQPAARAATPLPFIPEMDRPIQVKLATAKTLFDAGAALFLDARDAGEFEAGHIPGAMRLTRDDALSDPERVKTLAARGQPIVAYCDGGTCEASLDLARALVDAGYRKVLVLSGGFPEWTAAGHPVERGRGGR